MWDSVKYTVTMALWSCLSLFFLDLGSLISKMDIMMITAFLLTSLQHCKVKWDNVCINVP